MVCLAGLSAIHCLNETLAVQECFAGREGLARAPFTVSVTGKLMKVLPEAEQAGLQRGDRLLEVNGARYHRRLDLAQALRKARPGSELTLVVEQDSGAARLCQVRLEEGRVCEVSGMPGAVATLARLLPLAGWILSGLAFFAIWRRPNSPAAWCVFALLAGSAAMLSTGQASFQAPEWWWSLGPLVGALFSGIPAIGAALFPHFFPPGVEKGGWRSYVSAVLAAPLILRGAVSVIPPLLSAWDVSLAAHADAIILPFDRPSLWLSALAGFWFVGALGRRLVHPAEAAARHQIVKAGGWCLLGGGLVAGVAAGPAMQDSGLGLPGLAVLAGFGLMLGLPLALCYAVTAKAPAPFPMLAGRVWKTLFGPHAPAGLARWFDPSGHAPRAVEELRSELHGLDREQDRWRALARAVARAFDMKKVGVFLRRPEGGYETVAVEGLPEDYRAVFDDDFIGAQALAAGAPGADRKPRREECAILVDLEAAELAAIRDAGRFAGFLTLSLKGGRYAVTPEDSRMISRMLELAQDGGGDGERVIQAAGELARRLHGIQDREALFQTAARETAALLDLARLAFIMDGPGGYRYVAGAGYSEDFAASLPADGATISQLKAEMKDGKCDMPLEPAPAELEILEALGAQMLVPVGHGPHLTGLLALHWEVSPPPLIHARMDAARLIAEGLGQALGRGCPLAR